MKNFYLNIVAFCRWLRFQFTKWFLPLETYPDEADAGDAGPPAAASASRRSLPEREQKSIAPAGPSPADEAGRTLLPPTATNNAGKIPGAVKSATLQPAIAPAATASADAQENPAAELERRILDQLALCNSRTSRQLAAALKIDQETCRALLRRLIEDQLVSNSQKRDWYRLPAEARARRLLEHEAARRVIEILTEPLFRKNLVSLVQQLLERHPVELIPREGRFALRYRGCHALTLLVYPNSATFDLCGEYGAGFVECIHRENGINIARDGRGVAFDWHPAMPPASVLRLLDEALRLRFETPCRRRAESGAPTPRNAES